MSHLITLNHGTATATENEWTIVRLPASQAEERKQAGKVVLFKLTGEKTVTQEQISNTAIAPSGKIIVPLNVLIARKAELKERLASKQVGVWVDTHELLEDLIREVGDLNQLPIIAIHVERFADGRIFSLGTLLRSRYGFKNEMRAFGDILCDQMYFLKRSGFTSYLIRADRSVTQAILSLNDFTEPYQGAVDEPRPAFKRYHRASEC